MTSGRNALFCVQTRGAAYSNHSHWSMIEETLEIFIDCAAIQLAQPRRLFQIAAVDCGDLNTFDLASGAGVRLTNISAADYADMNHAGCRRI